jgi:hypothetical protein
LKFIPTNHRNPCPICQDTSGDCRITQDNLILCHSFIDIDSGCPGFRWSKASSNGVWGVHVPDNGKQFNREQYERYLELKVSQERNKKQFLADNALNADGRDRAIRKLANYVGLSDRDKQSLLQRGLSESQIKDGLFFSIDRWKRFNLNLPENFPGVRGDRFTTKDDGYACPAFDKKGRAIAWQLRVHGVTEGSKYRWAKSLYTSQLPNGEYPLTIVKPNENGNKRLYLSEGLLKPYIASQRHNLAVCGAANNGNFQGSPEQITEIISDYDEIVIVPDAADVLNPQVMRRWKQQINFLKRFNQPIKVLWWGQVKKSQGDIDEIDSATFRNAKYLTPFEFYELAKKQQFIQQQWDNWKNYKKFTPQIKIEKRFIEFDLPQSNTITFIKSGLGTGKTTETIKNLEKLQKYGIIGLGYRNTLLLQFNAKATKIGFYHLQSDKNLREFSLDEPQLKVTNCIDSLIYYVKEQFDGKIVIIDEVISVLKHLLFSGTIRQFDKVKELFTEMVNRCDRLLCLDGFMQDWAVTFFQELCPTKQIITIENIYQGNKAKVYLLEGTIDIDEKIRTNDKTPWIERLLNSQCPVICSDSQIFCEASEKLLVSQGRRGIRVDSKTVNNQDVKKFFTDPDQYILENQPEYVIYSPSAESGLDIPLKNYFSEHFAFFFGQLDVDSMIQMLGRIRDELVPKYVWAKKFIAPSDISRRPSNVESIQADRARLLMAELHLTINSVESPEAKIAYLQQVYQDNLDSTSTVADTITAIRNHEESNYRECLFEQLIDSGYPVEAVTPESIKNKKEIALQEKKAKTEVKEQNAIDIYNASDKYIGQNPINLSFDASWETRCGVIKAGLVSRLPDININPIWSPEFIKLVKYDQPNLIRQCELYYLLLNPELAKQLSLEKYNQIFNRGSIAAPWKLRQEYLKVKALRNIGLYDFIQTAIAHPDFTYTADSKEVKAIMNKCRRKKYRGVLGTPPTDPIKFINRLLRSVGIETKSRLIRTQGDAYGKRSLRHRVYQIDQKHLLSEERLAILESIKLKYDVKINLDNQPTRSLEVTSRACESVHSASLEWVADGENSLQNRPDEKSSLKMAETTDNNNFNPVTLGSKFYLNNSTKCDTLNNHQFLANLPRKMHTTDKIQKLMDSEEVSVFDSSEAKVFDTPEAIADLADLLTQIEDAEGLAELQLVPEFTRHRLNRACRLLPLKQQRLIRQWAIENDSRKSTASRG